MLCGNHHEFPVIIMLHKNTSQRKISINLYPEEGWFGHPKYSTPSKKTLVVSVSAFIFSSLYGALRLLALHKCKVSLGPGQWPKLTLTCVSCLSVRVRTCLQPTSFSGSFPHPSFLLHEKRWDPGTWLELNILRSRVVLGNKNRKNGRQEEFCRCEITGYNKRRGIRGNSLQHRCRKEKAYFN